MFRSLSAVTDNWQSAILNLVIGGTDNGMAGGILAFSGLNEDSIFAIANDEIAPLELIIIVLLQMEMLPLPRFLEDNNAGRKQISGEKQELWGDKIGEWGL